MKKILVPTDFSAPAGNALELATNLARKHGAAIHLLHAVDVPSTWQDAQFSTAVLATKPTKAPRRVPRRGVKVRPWARERKPRGINKSSDARFTCA